MLPESLRVLLAIFLGTASLFAQPAYTYFENIDQRNGLSHPHVTALLRDSRGFLWIGTGGGGLNRYDGHEMKVYRHSEDDSLSLCHDYVVRILEDQDGRLWVGTTGGVSRLNPTSGRFENFMAANGRLHTDFYNYPFNGQGNTIWTANHAGLEHYDPAANRFSRHSQSDSLGGPTSGWVDKNGTIWLGAIMYGLKKLVPTTGLCQTFNPFPVETGKMDLNSVGIRTDRSGNMWVISAMGGLLRFNPNNSSFEHFKDGPHIVSDIAETLDAEGNRIFWIASDIGLFRFSLKPGEFPDLSKPNRLIHAQTSNLADNALTVLYSDSKGSLWVGSRTHGLYRLTVRQEQMKTIKKAKEGTLGRIVFDNNGDVLLCGSYNPLTILDKNLNPKKIFKHVPERFKDDRSQMVWDAVQHPDDGKIYIANYSALTAYDEITGKMTWDHLLETIPDISIPRYLVRLIPAGKSRLLLGIWLGFPRLYDIQTGKIVKKLFGKKLIVRHMKRGKDDRIWVCSEGYLCRFDPKTEQDDIVFSEELGANFYDIHWDRSNRLWVATSKGLWQLDTGNYQILARYTAKDGLPGNSIGKIEEDTLGRLWVLGNFGAGYFEPRAKHFYTLSKSDGFDYNFASSTMAKSPDGHIWLASGNDIQIFRPEVFRDHPPSRVFMTGLKINERDTLLTVPFERIPEIRLNPGENVLTFTYTAIDLEVFGKTRFKYRLEGLTENWVNAGSNRVAAFVKLPAGTYTFRVRPEDAGESDAYDATLRVVVTDFIWQRKWFQGTLLFLLTILGGFAFVRWNNQRLRLRLVTLERTQALADFRQKTAESEMRALRAQMNPHFIFNSLNSINAYILRNEGKTANAYLTGFAQLMRQILDNSARETIPLETEIEFLQSYLRAESLRLENKLAWDIRVADSVDTFETEIPSMILQPYIENAVWHGIAHKPEGGTITVAIGRDASGALLCTVEDNGVGRARARELRPLSGRPHESKGLKITEERLALYDQKHGTRSTVVTTDLLDDKGHAAGTRVEVRIADLG